MENRKILSEIASVQCVEVRDVPIYLSSYQ